MPEEYLQVAFEIKSSCDEISRRILRWHWENRPGSHTLDALLAHVRERRQESPSYYDRLPDIDRKTSWQQFDTTLCMRILLDPENDAAKPLDLLGNTAHPGAARRACNAVRTARNEAAHAADRAAGGQAAVLFDEAVECLEAAYAGTAFSEKELAGYYRLADEYLARCGAGGHSPAAKAASAAPEPSVEVNVYPTGEARQKAAAARAAGGQVDAPPAEAAHAAKPRTARPQTEAARSCRPSGSSRKTGQKARSVSRSGKGGTKAKPKSTGRRRRRDTGSRAALVAALAALGLGLAARAAGMGLWPFG